MSWDIYMVDLKTKESIVFDEPHDFKGGNYAMDGTNEAWLNITWNYSEFYYKHIDSKQGIRWIYGKTGAEVLPVLEKAVKALGTKTEDDYWRKTSGNAGHALLGLIAFCKARPDGIFEGD